jgi:predicted alpha/beta superfamily hydrolase
MASVKISTLAVIALATTTSALSAQRGATPSTAVSSNASAPLSFGETFTIQSRVLGETRRINVYIPPADSDSAQVRLPVMYMPDGGMAEDFLHVAGLIQVLTGDGVMRPFILVGIENTERRRDMTGPTTVAEDRKIAAHVGGSAAFRQFVRTELMPDVEKRYRTTRERAIVGESLAGLFVVETFMLEPDLFDTYIAFDPSLWWNAESLVKTASDRLRALPPTPRRLYIASSDEPGIIAPLDRLIPILRADAPSTLQWHYDPLPAERHSTIYHPAALRAFRYLFKP